jgi:hypothetical protein
VIQDDAVVCANFGQAVGEIAAAHCNIPVCLFLGGFPQGTARMFMRALKLNQRYISLLRSPIVPLVAVLWPRAKAEEFLEWSTGHPRMTRADDGNAGRWHKDTNQEIRVCVPSLVEHPDMVPSVKGGQQARWGKDKQRVALSVAEDGLAYSW